MAAHRFADRVAVCITERSPIDAGRLLRKLDNESKASKAGEIQKYEVRFDAFKDGLSSFTALRNLETFLELVSGLEKRIIGTVTHQSEVIPFNQNFGFNGSEGNRGRYLQALSERVGYVSLEHNHFHQVSSREARRIVMMHMKRTPNLNDLLKLYAEMQKERNVDVVKLATVGTRMQDTLYMLQFAYMAQQNGGLPTIPLVMKEVGKISRVLAPYFGAEITFARCGEGSAPGQIGYPDIFRLFDQVDRMGLPDIMKFKAGDLKAYDEELFKVLES